MKDTYSLWNPNKVTNGGPFPAFLYEKMDRELYHRVPEGLYGPGTCAAMKRFSNPSVRVNQALYGFKQSGRLWYHCLETYLVEIDVRNDPLLPCIFVKRAGDEFAIIAVYLNDRDGGGARVTKTKQCWVQWRVSVTP